MSDNQQHSQPTNDLVWDAARYVWGELSPAESAAFEARLATDERACAAVAEAVQLSAALQAATTITAPPIRTASPTSRRAAAWICACAATLAGIALLSAWQPATTSTDVAALELVDRWVAENHATLPGELDIRDELDLEPEVLDESLSAPRWLLHAVQLTTEETP